MIDPRAEIVRLIAQNREDLQAEQVEALFVCTVEDLVAGGIDPVRVFASMLRGWVRLQVAMRGAGATAELLRDFADRVERPALNAPSQKKSEVRH
jgi:hypothetical protein